MNGDLAFHGGRLSDARARFGGRCVDWLDLSTGINPNPWPRAETIRPDWRALPDPRALRSLEETAAAFFGGDPARCCAVPGSESGLRALARILDLPGRHPVLCYGTHAGAFLHAEAVSGSLDGPATPSVLVLASPSNPDGRLTSRDDLLAALDRQESSGGWLIVDEAFADCHAGWSIADQVADDRRLIVTRSFGKFFGLAGVRLGFVLAPRSLLADLRKLQGEWPVCSAALAFAAAAYADTEWIAATRAALPAAAAHLDAVLIRHGLRPEGACPLFRLVETDTAPRLFAALARQHVLTRPFADHPRLLRFGLPADAQQLTRLDAALGQAMRHG
ncbi:L-threonine O-3-phosphate decarboxylase [Novosphingobium sp. CF614]|uniref:aminotransferase class I/II-fold pyridoxal phosphate-dependent enzyme n=1 Tax=Novosphingobium sp. CF614 TaxID=1884364 RepID=UPI0008EB37C0|nr:aminotransferase class I/II-fold pyridoxal phosphate-dependent enzyme [Novosphingobium sp. CF614]SFG24881.1 L-threonine O-3-phosphate decarboxylase [Novosphingobium sp. CF614]